MIWVKPCQMLKELWRFAQREPGTGDIVRRRSGAYDESRNSAFKICRRRCIYVA